VKIIFGWGSTLDPTAGAYDALQPLVGWRHPSPFPTSLMPLAPRPVSLHWMN